LTPELLLVVIVALLVLGPERMPQALRTLGLWLGRMRRSFNSVKNEIEREIGMDEIRRQLHNEAVMEELKRIERDVRSTADQAAGRTSGTPVTGAKDARSAHAAEGNDAPGAGTPPAGAARESATELEVGAPREVAPAASATPVDAPPTAPARSGARQDG
jgi:sec-independent protein translocase protein TatB